MEVKFFFKKYLPIYKSDNKICIGFIGSEVQYLELDYSIKNFNLLESILMNGISEFQLNDEFYSNLMEKNFFDKVEFLSNKRGELFLNYLSNDLFDKFKESSRKRILIFGAGAGGSSLIHILAQFGFHDLHIVDFDIVEESDLYRVMSFQRGQIGLKKGEALKENILRDFGVNIYTYDLQLIEYDELSNFIQKIAPVFIVKACDPKGKFIMNLNKICFQNSIPYITMAYSYEKIKIGPIFVPSVTSCYNFFSDFAISTFGEHYRIEKFERLFNLYLTHPSISFNINILSSIVFKEILFFLIDEFQYCQTIGRLIVINTLTLEQNNILVKCKNCDICSI